MNMENISTHFIQQHKKISIDIQLNFDHKYNIKETLFLSS